MWGPGRPHRAPGSLPGSYVSLIQHLPPFAPFSLPSCTLHRRLNPGPALCPEMGVAVGTWAFPAEGAEGTGRLRLSFSDPISPTLSRIPFQDSFLPQPFPTGHLQPSHGSKALPRRLYQHLLLSTTLGGVWTQA